MADDDPCDCASPPCLMDEVDPSYFGYLSRAEQIDLLNLLLECERAGARGVADIARRTATPQMLDALRGIAADEARFCAMLSGHIERLGATPSDLTGNFYAKLIALNSVEAQLDLLDRGQAWVADKLRDSLPKISSADLHRDLTEMLRAHEHNIQYARMLWPTKKLAP